MAWLNPKTGKIEDDGCMKDIIINETKPIKRIFAEWISVEDRLPFDDFDSSTCGTVGEFIVFFDDGEDPSVSFATYRKSSRESGWYYINCDEKHDYWVDKITHWMPLPEPPQGN